MVARVVARPALVWAARAGGCNDMMTKEQRARRDRARLTDAADDPSRFRVTRFGRRRRRGAWEWLVTAATLACAPAFMAYRWAFAWSRRA